MRILENYLYPFGLKLIDWWILMHLSLDWYLVMLCRTLSFISQKVTQVPGFFLYFYKAVKYGIVYRKHVLEVVKNYLRLKILHFIGAGYVNVEGGYYHVAYYDHLGNIRYLRWKKLRGVKGKISKVYAVDEENEEVDITPFVEKFLGPDGSFPNLALSPADLNFQNIKIENINGNEKIISDGENIAF